MKIVLLVAALGGLLAVAVVAAVRLWIGLGDVEINANGMVAMAIGAILTLALGIGLMGLVFYSSRSGHDDQTGR